MNSDITGERFIINAENRAYKPLVAEIADCFGIKPPAIHAKPWMMGAAWRLSKLASVFTGKAPAIDKVSAQSASIARDFDNSKLKKAINIQFKPVSESVKEISAALNTISGSN